MFAAVWFALVIFGSASSAVEMREHRQFKSETACWEHVEMYRARIPDVIRGHMGEPWEAKIVVEGRCMPAGEPA